MADIPRHALARRAHTVWLTQRGHKVAHLALDLSRQYEAPFGTLLGEAQGTAGGTGDATGHPCRPQRV